MLSLLFQIPTWLQRLYPGVIWRKNTSSKVVFLTFDDGPIPEVTPQVLDILREKNVKATFFMVGENAVRYPDLLTKVQEEGHAVGNHTYNHVKGVRCSTEEYMENVAKADAVLHTRLFRPPYGKMKPKQKQAILDLGYQIFLWDVLTHDYNDVYSAEQMMCIIRRYTRPGSIINFHDSLRSGDRMLTCLSEAIDWLKSEGYQFEILSE